ncbi:MAG: nicotinate phosphoribosyltransferase [Acidothermus cellulolyticus]|nr:nicotinate phosphoribosyltransferase [Acidothermus cellulolyticus]
MPSTALLTDRYELTMVQAALRSGAGHRRAVFEVFARRLPKGRRYGVVAGTARLLDAIADFRFDDDNLEWLVAEGVVDEPTARWLANFRFTGNIDGYAEGDVFFPGSPILVVESSFAEAVLLETLVLSILNHDCAVAAAASRMTLAAGDRPCLEMGGRRTHEHAAVAAARAAYLAGFAATSNLEAGRRYGIPTVGTSAHAFTLVHDSEEAAFRAQLTALGTATTLLVDTYDVPTAVRTAIRLAGAELGAVRIDSGDLVTEARAVRAQLDELGATKTRIIVTGDLDEYAIAALSAAPVDGYGVGTAVVTGSGAPTANLVYKLVARADESGCWRAVQKASPGKIGHGGRKWAFRRFDRRGIAEAEVIWSEAAPDHYRDGEHPPLDDRHRPLLVPLIRDGEIVGREPLDAARRRHREVRNTLPPAALHLQPGDPALPTVFAHEPPNR